MSLRINTSGQLPSYYVFIRFWEALEVDYIDESEVLTPADEEHHIMKSSFKVPFVCGCRNLGEALRRIAEGATMIRTKGEAGTGNIVEAVRHARTVNGEIRRIQTMADEELFSYAKEIQAPYELVRQTAKLGRLPVVNFAAGGVATPDRRCPDDAAWNGWCFRGIGNFQERRSREACESNRHGCYALQEQQDVGRDQRRPWRTHGWH